MPFSRTLLPLFFILSTITVSQAQEKENLWLCRLIQTADSLLTKRYFKADFDTLYLARPRTACTVKGRVNLSGSNMYLRGTSKGIGYNAMLYSDFKTTLNVSIGFRGLSIGVSVNPLSWTGKYHDYEFNLNSYGNRWGIDIVYHNQQSAEGWIKFNDQEQIRKLDAGTLLSKTLNADAYFVFNNKRFSIPAAFSQSYIQKRSAGSWLLGVSLMNQWVESTIDTQKIHSNKYSSLSIGVGAGYGYNFAMRKNWLLHLSAVPSVVIWSKTETWNGREWNKVSSHFPDVIMAGRAALVKNYRQNFMGISLIANFSAIGEASSMQVSTTKWRLRIFYGWRF